MDKVVEGVPTHQQLFVLMEANACTWSWEKGGVGSRDNTILGARLR